MKPVIFLLLAFILVAGCDSSNSTQQPEPEVEVADQKGTITRGLSHDGRDRTYILYVPDSYTGDDPVPVVFNFHGYTSNATEQMGYGDFRPIADTAGFVVVHPQGTLLDGSSHWNVGGWTLASTVDDVGFTSALLDQLIEDYNIDESRVYSTGMSNGGYMSFLLACQLSNRITAVASVTGSMTPETYNACDPQHPTPVLQIHGTDDNVVPYNGAVWSRSIEDVLDYWVSYNGCDGDMKSVADLANTSTADGSTVDHITYPCSAANAAVEHYQVAGGFHTWPGAEGPGTNQDINASTEIWRFFSQYALTGN